MPSESADPVDGGIGVLVLAADGTPTSASAAGECRLAELRDPGASEALPPAVTAMARLARGRGGQGAVARVRTASGRWLVMRSARLGVDEDAGIAVTVEFARPHDLAPVVADRHALTPRERAVARLVAQGLPTKEIAVRLEISSWTVQDHIRSACEKLGAGIRGAMVARLFFQSGVPQLVDTVEAWGQMRRAR